MKRLQRSLLMWCLFVCSVGLVSAQEKEADTLRISLLTCSPGTEIYELFGHTALRVQDQAEGTDWVFNYGIFDFNAPHFIWRFVKGETDYQLGIVPFEYFLWSYSQRNSTVVEQELNLSEAEKQKLLEELQHNYLPENRVYRYNYLYDNCTTRARVKVEEAIDGLVKYDENADLQTFRSIIHQYTAGHPWSQLGIDLCLGSEIDREISLRDKMFVPENLYKGFRRSVIVPTEGEFRNLVSQEIVLNTVEGQTVKEGISPLQCGLLVLLLVVILSVIGVIRDQTFWGIDVVLFAGAGLVGVVLAFLVFFSEHPAVSPNWNLCVFHPLHLLYLPFLIRHALRQEKEYYHLANLVVISLFIMFMGVLPQKINPAVLPLALSLWVRSGVYTLLTIGKWR